MVEYALILLALIALAVVGTLRTLGQDMVNLCMIWPEMHFLKNNK